MPVTILDPTTGKLVTIAVPQPRPQIAPRR